MEPMGGGESGDLWRVGMKEGSMVRGGGGHRSHGRGDEEDEGCEICRQTTFFLSLRKYIRPSPRVFFLVST